MESVLVVDFKCKEGMVEETGKLLREGLVETRSFDGCNSIEVYFEEKTATYTLIEDWKSLEHYEIYLQWREDGGIAEMLEPLIVDGLEGFKARIKWLGAVTDI